MPEMRHDSNSKELEKNLKVCTACGYHYRLSAMERIQMTLDEGQFVEYDADMISEDPLSFPDYRGEIGQSEEHDGLTGCDYYG